MATSNSTRIYTCLTDVTVTSAHRPFARRISMWAMTLSPTMRCETFLTTASVSPFVGGPRSTSIVSSTRGNGVPSSTSIAFWTGRLPSRMSQLRTQVDLVVLVPIAAVLGLLLVALVVLAIVHFLAGSPPRFFSGLNPEAIRLSHVSPLARRIHHQRA